MKSHTLRAFPTHLRTRPAGLFFLAASAPRSIVTIAVTVQ
jgi:hypothetical protein